MKKVIKILSIIILSIVTCYTVFIIEESIRLSKNQNAKPLIIIEENNKKNSSTYESLGFHLTNKYGVIEDKKIVVSQEFWLFDYFLIWGWIS